MYIQLQITLDEQAGVLHWTEIGSNGKPPSLNSRDLSHEQAEEVLRQMEAILGNTPAAPPAEPMVTLYGFTETWGGIGKTFTSVRENCEMVVRNRDNHSCRLITFRLPRRLWDTVQPEAVEAVNAKELGHA